MTDKVPPAQGHSDVVGKGVAEQAALGLAQSHAVSSSHMHWLLNTCILSGERLPLL